MFLNILFGISPIGQCCTHLPQETHGNVGPFFLSGRAKRPPLPFTMGTLSSGTSKPIIGPPLTSSKTSSFIPPQYSIKAENGVPMGARIFLGSLMHSPPTVILLSNRGLWYFTASKIAKVVDVLQTMQPISKGSFPEGISLPVTALRSCFSSPWGYFIFNGCISMG